MPLNSPTLGIFREFSLLFGYPTAAWCVEVYRLMEEENPNESYLSVLTSWATVGLPQPIEERR